MCGHFVQCNATACTSDNSVNVTLLFWLRTRKSRIVTCLLIWFKFLCLLYVGTFTSRLLQRTSDILQTYCCEMVQLGWFLAWKTNTRSMCKVPHNKYFKDYKNALIFNLFLVFPVKSIHMKQCHLSTFLWQQIVLFYEISEKCSWDMIVAFHYIHICELMSAVKNRYCNSSIIAAQLLYHPMWGCMVNYTKWCHPHI